MSNHPNRNRRPESRLRNPTPDEVIALRKKYDLTQTQAADRWLCTLRTVQGWEAPIGTTNHRRVHPLMWWGMQKILEMGDS